MASGSQTLTTYYAKRIIGDSAAATAAKALLQTGDNVTTDLWLLHRSNRGTSLYGILYKYDGTNGHDKLQAYGASNVTAWVQLDTGDTYLAGKVGIGYDPNTSGNTYKLYVNGTSYFNGQITGAGGIILPWIELSSATPYIDWHFGSSTADYTSRIIESSSGYLEVNAKLGINGSNTSYNFYVNGSSYFNGNTTHNGIVYFADGTTYYINNSGTAKLNDATIVGTLYLTRTTDAEATADNRPALLIGPYNGAHLEFDGNEIMAKGSATTTSTLYLNNNGGQTYFGGDISCASTLTVRAENTTTEGGQICLAADPNHSSYAAYLDVCNNYFRVHSNGQERFTVNLSSYGTSSFNGLVQITKNSNTVTIGSANTSWCHFENSANISFYFNKSVHVDGDVYRYNTKVHMSSSGFHPPKNGGIYWDPYVESASDASDVTQIIQVAGGVAGGTELRIQQANDSNDVINLVSPYYIYLNSKKAFTINDGWLRINDGGGFDSGVYFGSSVVRTDGELWSDSIRLVDNWVGFYNSVQGGTRYGYIQADANRMYFRKENGANNGIGFDFGDDIYCSNEIISGTSNGFRIKNLIMRNDGADFYFLYGTSNTPGDNWNTLRPFRINNSSGQVYIGHNMYTSHIIPGSGCRVGGSGGALYLGNSDNANWVYVQDIASQSGTDKWAIHQTNGNAEFYGTITAGSISAHGIWANRVDGEKQVGVDNGTAGTLYLWSNNGEKGIYSSTGYQTGYVIRITSGERRFYGVSTSADSTYVTGSSGTLYLTGVPEYATKNQTHYIYSPNYINSGNYYGYGLLMPTNVTSYSASQPMAICYGRVQCYGTLNINADTDGSHSEYVIITSGRGCSSSTADGLYVAYDHAGVNHGPFYLKANQYTFKQGALNCQNSNIIGVNGIFMADNCESFGEGICFYRSGSTCDSMAASGGMFYFCSDQGDVGLSSANANAWLKAAVISLWPGANGNYNEGIRVHSSNGNWATIMLCGSDNTGDSGTSGNSWGFFNNGGNFYITRNGSSSGSSWLECVSSQWRFRTNSSIQFLTTSGGAQNIMVYGIGCGPDYSQFDLGNYRLHVNGNGRISGNLWVSSSNTTGGGIILSDDGDIVDLNDGYCALRFSYGIGITTGNRSGGYVTRIHSNGHIYMSAGKRIGESGGDLYLGNSGNQGWLYVQDMASQSGTGNWRMYTDGRLFCNRVSTRDPNGFRVVYGSYGFIIRNDSSNTYFMPATNAEDGNTWYGHYSYVGNGDGYWHFVRAYGAVWNDYAEYRIANTIEPGRVVKDTKNGKMELVNERLAPACKVISDTYGFAIGETVDAKTPIAVSGRVLVYPYQSLDKYEIGAAVCSAPGGTIDIMTREEVMQYPERIIGTVSEIPNYEIWKQTRPDVSGNNNPYTHEIPVKGRIWIYVR